MDNWANTRKPDASDASGCHVGILGNLKANVWFVVKARTTHNILGRPETDVARKRDCEVEHRATGHTIETGFS